MRISDWSSDVCSSDRLTELDPAPRQIVSNLPYNISTALLVRWLTALAADPGAFSAMTLMFQKEVAERLVAAPRSPAYGRLPVLPQWLCQPRPLFDIPLRAFTPPPTVDSKTGSAPGRERGCRYVLN